MDSETYLDEAEGATAERDALAVLELGTAATLDDAEIAYDEISTFLKGAPKAARAWAHRRQAELDAALETLEKARPAAPSGNGARGPAPSAPFVVSDADDPDELFDTLEGGSPARSGRDRRPVGRAAAARPNRLAGRAARPTSVLAIGGNSRRLLLSGGLVAALALGAFAIYKLGEPAVPGLTGTPAPNASSVVDQAKVLEFMDKLAADPKDITALQGLSNLYYAAGQYATAATWLDKILDIEPKNVTALLGAGAAAYNLGNLADAEARWRAVLDVDPKNVLAHYDLGFMYLSQSPPAMDKVRAEWSQVIALDPNSDLAKTVSAHLRQLDPSFSPPPASGAPATGAPPSGAPATPAPSPGPASPGASPAASPAAS